jgi:hypothetical protein
LRALLYDNAHFIGCRLQVSNRFVGMMLFLDGNLRAFMCFIVNFQTKDCCDSLCGVDNNHLMVVSQWLQIGLAQCFVIRRNVLLFDLTLVATRMSHVGI